MLVKICGVKTLTAAKVAGGSGADFIGLNFVPSSKRRISLRQAKKIIGGFKKNEKPKFVGVFKDQPIVYVNKAADFLKLDFVQLHGKESPEYCGKMRVPVIKAVNLPPDFSVPALSAGMSKYKVRYFLVDRADRDGAVLNFSKVKQIARKFPVILAGGLGPGNVAAAIKASGKIKGVDTARGVETGGRKDPVKIKKFIRSANLDRIGNQQ